MRTSILTMKESLHFIQLCWNVMDDLQVDCLRLSKPELFWPQPLKCLKTLNSEKPYIFPWLPSAILSSVWWRLICTSCSRHRNWAMITSVTFCTKSYEGWSTSTRLMYFIGIWNPVIFCWIQHATSRYLTECETCFSSCAGARVISLIAIQIVSFFVPYHIHHNANFNQRVKFHRRLFDGKRLSTYL